MIHLILCLATFIVAIQAGCDGTTCFCDGSEKQASCAAGQSAMRCEVSHTQSGFTYTKRCTQFANACDQRCAFEEYRVEAVEQCEAFAKGQGAPDSLAQTQCAAVPSVDDLLDTTQFTFCGDTTKCQSPMCYPGCNDLEDCNDGVCEEKPACGDITAGADGICYIGAAEQPYRDCKDVGGTFQCVVQPACDEGTDGENGKCYTDSDKDAVEPTEKCRETSVGSGTYSCQDRTPSPTVCGGEGVCGSTDKCDNSRCVDKGCNAGGVQCDAATMNCVGDPGTCQEKTCHAQKVCPLASNECKDGECVVAVYDCAANCAAGDKYKCDLAPIEQFGFGFDYPCTNFDSQCAASCKVAETLAAAKAACDEVPDVSAYCGFIPQSSDGVDTVCKRLDEQCPVVTPTPPECDTSGDDCNAGPVYCEFPEITPPIPCTNYQDKCRADCAMSEFFKDNFYVTLPPEAQEDLLWNADDTKAKCHTGQCNICLQPPWWSSFEICAGNVESGEGCSILLDLDLDICIIDGRTDRDKMQQDINTAFWYVVDQIEKAENFCDGGGIYFEAWGSKFTSDATKVAGENTPAADGGAQCPYQNIEARCKTKSAEWVGSVQFKSALYCGACARSDCTAQCDKTGALYQGILNYLTSGELERVFNEKMVETSAVDDTLCLKGFGKVEFEDASLTSRNENLETIQTIDLLDRGGAMGKGGMVGMGMVLVVGMSLFF